MSTKMMYQPFIPEKTRRGVAPREISFMIFVMKETIHLKGQILLWEKSAEEAFHPLTSI